MKAIILNKSKFVPPLASTQALRRLRHTLIALSM